MPVANFVRWIVLAGVLGIALGSSLHWSLWAEPNYQTRADAHQTDNPHVGQPPPHDESQATSSKHKEHHNRDFWGPEWFLVWFTGPLALFTGLLFYYTRKLAADAREASVQALTASTEATNLAREEFTATHRPHVVLRRAYAPITDPLDFKISITYTLVNTGETRAHIEEIRLRLEFRQQSGYPLHAIPIGESDFLIREPPFWLEAGEARELTYADLEQVWDQARRREFEVQNQGLFFIGRVVYADDSPRKTKRRTAWYRKYDIHRQSFGAFVWDAPNEYEYKD